MATHDSGKKQQLPSSLPLIDSSSPRSGRTKGTYHLVSLGCPKNLVDSERMAGILAQQGYRLVAEPEKADFAVVNTCGFIGDARDESFKAIREMLQLKQQGRLQGVIVTGCLAQRDRDALFRDFAEVDQLVGVFARDEIATAADRLMGGVSQSRTIFSPAPVRPLSDAGRLRLTPRHLAHLRIAEGCNRLCTFCAIPQIRGRYASKPVEQVLDEARQLAADGVRELVLVAQDTSSYGLDIYGRPRLAELLRQLDRLDDIAWIRLMYLYPLHVSDELVEVLASAEKVLPYLDLPLQHINDDVLGRMSRLVDRAQTERLLDRLRQQIDRLVLRTTFLVGFPGETEQQFEELLEFVRQRQFERLGVFAYSDEPGTPSAELDGKVPEEVKQARRDRLMAVQQEIAFAHNAAQLGRRLDALIDSDIPGEENAHVARTYADAPEVDGVVYLTGDDLRPGQIVPCEIVASREYDLIGAAVGEPG